MMDIVVARNCTHVVVEMGHLYVYGSASQSELMEVIPIHADSMRGWGKVIK